VKNLRRDFIYVRAFSGFYKKKLANMLVAKIYKVCVCVYGLNPNLIIYFQAQIHEQNWAGD
jgi:hypothetical protein